MTREEEIMQAALDYANNQKDIPLNSEFNRTLCIALGQAFRDGAQWADGSVEYARTDAFIEKAEEFIYSALNDGIMGTANIEDFMRLFKIYMKEE